MKNLLKFSTLFLIFSVFNTFALHAQCDKCPASDTQKPDYCYTHVKFPGHCAQFSGTGTQTRYFAGAKSKQAISLNIIDDVTPESLLELIQAQPKLSAKDIAFLTGAFQTWKSAKLDLGFISLPSGLKYKVVQEGAGKYPEKGKKVKVHYKGYLTDGTKFDSSFDRNEPIEITLGVGQVIKGWDEGIGLFKVGSKGVLKIPAELGYGARGVGSIPANSTLFFDIEVISAE